MTVIDKLGLADEGLLRVGFACYTTFEEVERLINGVKNLSKI